MNYINILHIQKFVIGIVFEDKIVRSETWYINDQIIMTDDGKHPFKFFK